MTEYAAQPTQPVEDINRGTVLALLAIPAGVIVFVIIWSIGFIASAVTLGVAYLAMFLYQRGSGGMVGRAGAIRVAIITGVTVVLSIIAGLISDVAIGIGQIANISPFEALSTPQFGTVFSFYLTDPEAQASFIPSVLIAVAFAALGCFGVLRAAFRATAAPQAQPVQPPVEETPAS